MLELGLFGLGGRGAHGGGGALGGGGEGARGGGGELGLGGGVGRVGRARCRAADTACLGRSAEKGTTYLIDSLLGAFSHTTKS